MPNMFGGDQFDPSYAPHMHDQTDPNLITRANDHYRWESDGRVFHGTVNGGGHYIQEWEVPSEVMTERQMKLAARKATSTSKCEICGEPMPPGEEMFKFHGYSGDCPKTPLEGQKTLEQYLRDAAAAGAIDHSIRCRITAAGDVTFYVHPDGKDGDTCDYLVKGNTLSRDPNVTKGS